MTTDSLGDPDIESWSALRRKLHPRCIACSPTNPLGLGLEFSLESDGGVKASIRSNELLQGYSGQLHGGVVATLLDSAMANCLFAHKRPAVTAELSVRYRHPVATTTEIIVRAWIIKSHRPLHLLKAELKQNGEIKATATAKFYDISTEA